MRGTVSGGLRFVLTAPVPFVMTPLVLHKIGVAGYGTWAVLLAINGLTSLADLGLVGTLSKFVAEYHAKQDFAALTRLLSSGLALFLMLDLVIGTGLWLASPLLALKLFHGSSLPAAELVFLLRCFLILVAANILTQLFASVTTGLQRLDLTNLIGAANVVLGAFFGASLLLLGRGLRGLVFGYTGAGILTVAAYFLAVRRLLPQIVLNPTRFDRIEAGKMFGYSLRLYVTQAASAVHNQVEKIILATLVGVAPAGWYDIASETAIKVRGAIGYVLGPVLAAASELNALGDESRMKELYYRAHKYLALCGVPAVCYVVAISRRFIELWIGPSLGMVAVPMIIILLVNYLSLATGPGFLIFAGIGYFRPSIQSAILGLSTNVVLSLILIYKFGFAGAVTGMAIAMCLSATFFLVAFRRRTGYSVGRVLRESYMKPVFCSIPLLLILFAIFPASQLSWFGLVGVGVVFGILYLAAILITGFLDDYDWDRIEQFAPILAHARKAGRTD